MPSNNRQQNWLRYFALKGLSDVLLTSKGENNAFPPPSPPYNVVPLFELPIENNKHPRGQGRGVDCLAYLNTISPRFCRQFEFLHR